MDHFNYEIKPDCAKMWEDGISGAWAQQWIARHGSIDELTHDLKDVIKEYLADMMKMVRNCTGRGDQKLL